MRITAVASVVLFLTACTWTGDEPPGGPPNIVVILADDMGYGDASPLNPDSRLRTPHLQSLASQGMTFVDSHSPSAVCTPTRYGLLTGRYCWRSRLKSGVLGGYSKPLLEPGRPTVADLLQDAGYHTGAVGKWHLGMELPLLQDDADIKRWDGDPGIDFAGVISDSPVHHGFHEYFGVSASLDMAPYVFIRDDRFTMLPSEQQPGLPFPRFLRKGPRAADFVVDEVLDRLTEEAVGFIERAAAGAAPFFLYLPLSAPHKPAWPHQRFQGRTELGDYGDFVVQVDWTVGQVLEALEAAGVAEDTLVIFTSDNGSYMHRYDEGDREDHVDQPSVQGFRAETHRANGPFRGTKADIFEAGHHVPFFARWPGHIEPGSTAAQTICHTDLFATLADIVGVALPVDAAEDSISFRPALEGDPQPRAAPVVHHSSAGMFAIRDGPWKLILGNGSGGRAEPKGKPFEGPYQLFHLGQDVAETNDLLDQYPEQAARLEQQLEVIRSSGRSIEAERRIH